jgi:hypothetical protein
MLYASVEPWQTDALPEMVPGCAGTVVVVTARVLAVLVPQPFEAVTEMSPPFGPTVAVMELVVEVPVHPAGRVHV